jgi:hypothetical protein
MFGLSIVSADQTEEMHWKSPEDMPLWGMSQTDRSLAQYVHPRLICCPICSFAPTHVTHHGYMSLVPLQACKCGWGIHRHHWLNPSSWTIKGGSTLSLITIPLIPTCLTRCVNLQLSTMSEETTSEFLYDLLICFYADPLVYSSSQ